MVAAWGGCGLRRPQKRFKPLSLSDHGSCMCNVRLHLRAQHDRGPRRNAGAAGPLQQWCPQVPWMPAMTVLRKRGPNVFWFLAAPGHIRCSTSSEQLVPFKSQWPIPQSREPLSVAGVASCTASNSNSCGQPDAGGMAAFAVPRADGSTAGLCWLPGHLLRFSSESL